eukprot:CAMPEP_0194390256 /NCGR_PEP_ID=MMETSP0174-20130528/108927_1 /TAXON_ID=216777 /ORGANISM="Proboscia alata, Strain PI-D3" /LENGTH=576 /DNA_ID=CAMNT_0039183409 /DNA_START=102 /DNA_END=1832 /DNA_ORIENTATION=-
MKKEDDDNDDVKKLKGWKLKLKKRKKGENNDNQIIDAIDDGKTAIAASSPSSSTSNNDPAVANEILLDETKNTRRETLSKFDNDNIEEEPLLDGEKLPPMPLPTQAEKNQVVCMEEQTAKKLRFVTFKILNRISHESAVISKDKEKPIPRFEMKELELGKVLGKGGFGIVHELLDVLMNSPGDRAHHPSEQHHIALSSSPPSKKKKRASFKGCLGRSPNENNLSYSDGISLIDRDRYFIASTCLRNPISRNNLNSVEARYAVKKLSKKTMNNLKKLKVGVIDLCIEARFLASLSHPNIIKLRGLPHDKYIGTGNYFVMIDRLYDTLQARSKYQWRVRESELANNRFIWRKRRKERKLADERLFVAFEICAAMKYLHERNVVYRDLKPENLAFDIRNDIKLFDFGLAKELRSELIIRNNVVKSSTDTSGKDGGIENIDISLITDDPVYKCTGCTGSLRYMAPEVARSTPYNLKVDVFSFSILLWEICTLRVAFKEQTPATHFQKVVIEGLRPPFDRRKDNEFVCPRNIRKMIERGWNNDMRKRPNFPEIYDILQDEIRKLRKSNDPQSSHEKRYTIQ